MRGQAKFRQDKIAARRRRRTFYLCLYAVAAAGLLLSALSYISGLSALSIQSVEVSGNSRLPVSEIEAVARQDISGTYAYFFSRSNVLLYPREQITRDLLAIPLVKTAEVSRRGVGTLTIAVTEKETAAIWCAGQYGDAADCYSVDESGFVFAPEAPRSDSFIYRGIIEGDPLGKRILTPESFGKIRFFMTELAGLSVEPREAELAASSTYMTVYLSQGGRLVINTADDLSTILGNIASIISTKSIAPSLAGFLKNLDYIKLDVGNKVVYKLKGK